MPGDKPVDGLVAGLTGTARIMTVNKENAVSVPNSAVFDDPDTDASVVYLPGEKPRKRPVTVGVVTADRTEILEGLAEGEEILSEKP